MTTGRSLRVSESEFCCGATCLAPNKSVDFSSVKIDNDIGNVFHSRGEYATMKYVIFGRESRSALGRRLSLIDLLTIDQYQHNIDR